MLKQQRHTDSLGSVLNLVHCPQKPRPFVEGFPLCGDTSIITDATVFINHGCKLELVDASFFRTCPVLIVIVVQVGMQAGQTGAQ